MTHDPSQSPWYKQIWAWFVIAILAFAVFIGIGLLLVATMNPDSLVRDNYYSEGKAINMTLDRDHHARDMGIAASFLVDSVTGDISLQLEGDLPALPRSLTLDLISPAHASRDRCGARGSGGPFGGGASGGGGPAAAANSAAAETARSDAAAAASAALGGGRRAYETSELDGMEP